jgi:hypothetical protein
MAGTVPQDGRAEDVDRVLRKHTVAIEVQRRVREVDRGPPVVFSDRGAQQDRLLLVDTELEAAQEAGRVVVEPLLPMPNGVNVSMAIEDGERLTSRRSKTANVSPALRTRVRWSASAELARM